MQSKYIWNFKHSSDQIPSSTMDASGNVSAFNQLDQDRSESITELLVDFSDPETSNDESGQAKARKNRQFDAASKALYECSTGNRLDYITSVGTSSSP